MAELLSKEERLRLLKTLEEDAEFRYAVAGLIGLREVLDRLDRVEESIRRLWEEVRALREGQGRIWEETRKLWEEVRGLREGQNKLWEEVRELRRGQEKLWEEVKKLREDQNKLWEEVRELRRGQERTWRDIDKLRTGLRQLGKAVGATLDHLVASFLEAYLAERGFPEEELEVHANVKLMYRDRVVELDLFSEEPLVVGEVTTYLGTAEEAGREVAKLLEGVRAVEEVYGRRVELAVLAVANLGREAAEALERLAKQHGVMVLTGKEVEALA